MRIRSVTLRHYRQHRELKVALDPQRTLIGGPNESGKSTWVEALHRALFLKAKGNTELHRAMVPQPNTGVPEVEVVFEAAGSEWRLHKRFGPNGATSLSNVTAGAGARMGAEAEEQLAGLLGVAGGLTPSQVVQQWAHLWVWQGDAGGDPTERASEPATGFLRRLQVLGGAGALVSDLDARVAAKFAAERGRIFTQAGAPLVSSELGRAETAFTQAVEAREMAAARMDRLMAADGDWQSATRQVRETKDSLERLDREAGATAARLAAAAQLRERESGEARLVEEAKRDHGARQAADASIREERAKLETARAALRPQREALTAADQALADGAVGLATREHAWRTAAETARRLRMRLELARARGAFEEKKTAAQRCREREAQAAPLRARRLEIEGQRARLPVVDPAGLRALRTLETEAVRSRSALEAMATGLEILSIDGPSSVSVGGETLPAGGRRVLTDDTEVMVDAGAGRAEMEPRVRLRIQPGGGTSLADARKAAEMARQALADALARLGIGSVQDAAEALARREQFANSLQNLEAELRGLRADALPLELEAVARDEATALALVGRLESSLAAEPEGGSGEAVAGVADLEAAVRTAERAETEARAARDQAATAREGAEANSKRLRSALEQDERALSEAEGRLKGLVETHGDDANRTAALAAAGAGLQAALARLEATRAELTAMRPEQLTADAARLARAVEQTNAEREAALQREAAAASTLRPNGTEDPRAALEAAIAREKSAAAHRDSVRRRAEAIRLLDQLFRDEQLRLAGQLTRPWAERIGGYLECLFGAGTTVQVTLENHAFKDLIVRRPGAGGAGVPVEFSALSGGAKEQVAAAVRLAMAEVLAADHDGCLPVVFDDAFAYSDPDRVQVLQRMLDLAGRRGLQVIVLSCNPADYAALGARTVMLG